MPRKKIQPASSETPERRLVKVHLSEDEFRLLKMAAAWKGFSAGQLARDAALAEAREVLKRVKLD